MSIKNFASRHCTLMCCNFGFVLFLLLITECHQGLALSEEKRLIKQLIDNYTIDGKYGRPIKMMNATLRVGYGISLVQIMDVDEKDQVLTTNVWCKYVSIFSSMPFPNFNFIFNLGLAR